MDDRRRALPSVARLLSDARLEPLAARWSHRALAAAARAEIARAREGVAAGGAAPDTGELARRCAERLQSLERPRPGRVINATGVVVHTNLGRVPLSGEAAEATAGAAVRYSDLEFDPARGARGSRRRVTAELFELMLPDAATLVVNNNAAAVLLALDTLARGREVIVSRGELVEIGGSFRIPEILERSGARLVEVGTTNRTHPRDYEAAVTDETAAILKVWPSNFKIVGFTASVPVERLAEIAAPRRLPLVVDQGCGRLLEGAPGPSSDPSVEALLRSGADLVCFSGDKLLGGPQAGVIAGRPSLVERCARNPLARALRPGKLTLAALAATLRAWLHPDPAALLPAARMLGAGEADLRARAERLAAALREAAPVAVVRCVPGASRVGGGAAPEEDLPTTLVELRLPGVSEAAFAAALRAQEPPVIARTAEGAIRLDPRTLADDELPLVVRAVAAAAAAAPRAAGAE